MSIIETKREDPHCNCGGKLIPHTSAGRGRYRDLPGLLYCERCWTSWNPLPDGTNRLEPVSILHLAYVKSRRGRCAG